MKVEKIINNNVVSTFDDSGMEVVVMGRGIGFRMKTGDLIDQKKIEKVFRIENEEALSRFEQLLVNLPLEHIQVSNDIISFAKKEMDVKLNHNVYLTLTDHINFAIERFRNGDVFHNALLMEVKMFYPKEYRVGKYALQLIKDKTGVELLEDEAASIALHILNAELNTKIRDVWSLTTFIQKTLEIIEEEFDLEKVLDTRGEYLISSLKLLGKRLLIDSHIERKSDALVDFVKKEYKEEYRCAERVADFIRSEYGCAMGDEEKTYLALDLKRITRSC